MSFFHFKNFSIRQDNSSMKVGTDAMLLGSFIPSEEHSEALEIGTGTGVISLMLAQKNNQLTIDAIEIDENAHVDASFNFLNSNFPNTINAIHADFLTWKLQKKYDLIFSNPPYYSDCLEPENELKKQSKHIGNLSIHSLFEKSSASLSVKGKLWFIYPFADQQLWDNCANLFLLHKVQSIDVFSKLSIPIRTIACYSFIPQKTIRKQFIIRTETNCYTDEYIELTKDFHNKLPIR